MPEADIVIAKVRSLLIDTLYVPEESLADVNAHLFTTGLLDSADLVTLMSFLEHEFGIVIDDAEVIIENFDTLSAIAGLVAKMES